MSGQYSIESEEERAIIKKVLDAHNIDYEDCEVSINISNYNSEAKKGDRCVKENIYIQVD